MERNYNPYANIEKKYDGDKFSQKLTNSKKCDNYICMNRRKESTLKMCVKCQLAWYCDDICQKQDWIYHQQNCIDFEILLRCYSGN